MIGNIIVVCVVTIVLFLAIRPLVKFYKGRDEEEDYSCYGCSNSCKGKKCNKTKEDASI